MAKKKEERVPEIFLVSDHTGETAASAARAAMSQFRTRWRYRFFGEIREESQVLRMMELARDLGTIVLYTLSRDSVAEAIRRRGVEMGVPVVDLLGPVMETVASHYQLKREFRPGPQHGFTDEHFRRVDAVEFAVRHDDGTNLRSLYEADIVLTGVSRTSKTPVCMYLAQRGYKTGNVPLVPDIDPPSELLEIDPGRVFGLTLDPVTLVAIRRARLRALPSLNRLAYADPETVATELRWALRFFRSRGWRSVDISGKAVEENASRILELLAAEQEVAFP
jgi:[pyruvate, water dikinase]-phosphate phosphotransferase / [pyruvate, water dikinase] kinase